MNLIKLIFSALFPCRHNEPLCKGNLFGCRCGKGGGGTTVVQAPPPQPQPNTADAIQAYIQGLPQMYQAQLDWGSKIAEQDIQTQLNALPQLTAMTTGLEQQYSPALAASQWGLQQQYAPLYAQQQQELQRQYEPGAYGALQGLGAQMTPEYLAGGRIPTSTPLTSQLSGMMTPEYLTGYSAQEAPGMQAARERIAQQARSAWANRGLAQSGMSAEAEARMLSEFELPYALQQEQLTQGVLGQRQDLASSLAQQQLAQQNAYYNELGRRQNVGLSLAGRYNVPTQPSITAPQVQVPSYQGTNLMSGYNLPNIMNFMQQGYGTYAQAARPIALQNTKKYGLGWLMG